MSVSTARAQANPPAAGTLQFNASAYSVNEADGTANLTVNRVGGASGEVGVFFTAGSETAKPDEDYTNPPRFSAVTWADGDSAPKTISIPIFNDDNAEPTETFSVFIFNAFGGAAVGDPAAAVVTILDDDSSLPAAGTLQFSASAYTVNEAAGAATITVTRVGGTGGRIGAAWATADAVATGHANATANVDYVATNGFGGTLVWENGDSTPKTFTVTILNDGNVEAPEDLLVTLSPAVSNRTVLGSPAQAVLTILDDDSPLPAAGTLQFSAGSYTVDETAGTATVAVTRVGGSGGRVSVAYGTSDAGATANADYVPASGTLVWEDGDSSPKTFTAPILDDSEVEAPENVRLTLSMTDQTSRAVLGDPAQATLTIISDDVELPAVKLTALLSSIVAGTGQTGAFLFERTGDTSGNLVVSYAVKGSAVVGTDYARLRGKVKIKAGHSSVLLRVRPTGEGRGPGGKAVVKLSLLPGGAYAVDPAAPKAAKLKILGQ